MILYLFWKPEIWNTTKCKDWVSDIEIADSINTDSDCIFSENLGITFVFLQGSIELTRTDLLWWNIKGNSSKIHTLIAVNTRDYEEYSWTLTHICSKYKIFYINAKFLSFITFAPPFRNLPSRNITALSYSWTTFKSVFRTKTIWIC